MVVCTSRYSSVYRTPRHFNRVLDRSNTCIAFDLLFGSPYRSSRGNSRSLGKKVNRPGLEEEVGSVVESYYLFTPRLNLFGPESTLGSNLVDKLSDGMFVSWSRFGYLDCPMLRALQQQYDIAYATPQAGLQTRPTACLYWSSSKMVLPEPHCVRAYTEAWRRTVAGSQSRARSAQRPSAPSHEHSVDIVPQPGFPRFPLV